VTYSFINMMFISTGILDDKLRPQILSVGTTANVPLNNYSVFCVVVSRSLLVLFRFEHCIICSNHCQNNEQSECLLRPQLLIPRPRFNKTWLAVPAPLVTPIVLMLVLIPAPIVTPRFPGTYAGDFTNQHLIADHRGYLSSNNRLDR
jgi:hypothetical protein